MVLSPLAACVAMLALSAPGCSPRPPAHAEGVEEEERRLAFVSAEDDDRLVVVDVGARRVLRSIRVANGPHNVAASEDGRHVLVTSPPAGRVTLVSGRTLRVVKVFRGLGYPHDVELDGRYAYVTDEGRAQLVVLDLARRRVAARVAVAPRPHDLAVGDVISVTHDPRSARLTILDRERRARPRVVRRLGANGPAHDIVRRPDSATVYVSYWNSGVVAALDTGTGRFAFRRRVGNLVHHLAFDYYSARHVWATDHAGGRVLLLSAENGRRLRSISGCPGAHHVAIVAPRRAAVACHDSGRLLLVTASGRRLAAIRVGRGLHGVAVARVAR